MEVSVPELWAHCPSKQLLAQNQRSLRPLQVYPFQQASEGQSRLTFTPAGWSQQGLPRLSTTLIEDIMICYLGGVKMQMKDVALEQLCQRKIEMPEVTLCKMVCGIFPAFQRRGTIWTVRDSPALGLTRWLIHQAGWPALRRMGNPTIGVNVRHTKATGWMAVLALSSAETSLSCCQDYSGTIPAARIQSSAHFS